MKGIENKMGNPVIMMSNITRKQILSINKEAITHLFLFGDNMVQTGRAGQAAEIRYTPGALGVPTKWLPNNTPRSFFSDQDFDEVKPYIDAPFHIARAWVEYGRRVVIPFNGIGTGLADLPNKAPKIFDLIQEHIKYLRQYKNEYLDV